MLFTLSFFFLRTIASRATMLLETQLIKLFDKMMRNIVTNVTVTPVGIR